MNPPNNTKKNPAKKAAKEGGAVAGLAVLLAILLESLRSQHPDLPWDPSHDAALIGAGTGICFGLFRWLRKLIKRRRQRNGNPQAG